MQPSSSAPALVSLLQTLAALDANLHDALTRIERDSGGKIGAESLSRVRAALDGVQPEVASAAATVIRQLLAQPLPHQGQHHPQLMPLQVHIANPPGSPFSQAGAQQRQASATATSVGVTPTATAASPTRSPLSPAGSSSGSIPARKLSSLGVSLSVDVSAASESDSSDEEEEEEGEGAQEEQEIEQTSQRSTSYIVAAAPKDTAQDASRERACSLPVPGSTGASRFSSQQQRQQQHQHQQQQPAPAAARQQQQKEEQLPAANGVKAALLRESWGSKLSKRPPTPGVALGKPASGMFAESGKQPGGQQHKLIMKDEEAYGKAGSSGAGGVRFAAQMEAVKIIHQPEFDRSTSASSGSASSDQEQQHDEQEGKIVEQQQAQPYKPPSLARGGSWPGARVAGSSTAPPPPSTAALLARGSKELTMEWESKLAKRPPTPGMSLGSPPSIFKARKVQEEEAKDLAYAAVPPTKPAAKRRAPGSAAAAGEAASEPSASPGRLSPAITALVGHNPDLGLDMLETTGASRSAPSGPETAAAHSTKEGGKGGGSGGGSFATKLLKRPPTPGVGLGKGPSVFKGGDDGSAEDDEEPGRCEGSHGAAVQQVVRKADSPAPADSTAINRSSKSSPSASSKASSTSSSPAENRRVTFEGESGVRSAGSPPAVVTAAPGGSRSSSRGSSRGSSAGRRRVTFEDEQEQPRRRVTFGDERGGEKGHLQQQQLEGRRRVTFEEDQSAAAQQRRKPALRWQSPPPPRPQAAEVAACPSSEPASGLVAALRSAYSWEGKLSKRPPTPAVALKTANNTFREAAAAADAPPTAVPVVQQQAAAATAGEPQQPRTVISSSGAKLAAAKGGSAALKAELAEGRGKAARPPTPGAALNMKSSGGSGAGSHAPVNIFASNEQGEEMGGQQAGGFGAWSAKVSGLGAAAAAAPVCSAPMAASALMMLAEHNPDIATDLRESGVIGTVVGLHPMSSKLHSGGGKGIGAVDKQSGNGAGGGVAANTGPAGRRPPTPGATLGKQFNMFADDESEEEEDQGGSGNNGTSLVRTKQLPGVVINSAKLPTVPQSSVPKAGAVCVRPRAHSISPDPMTPVTPAAVQSVPPQAPQAVQAPVRRSTSPLHAVTTAADVAAEEAAAHASPLRRCSSASDPDPARRSPLGLTASASGAKAGGGSGGAAAAAGVSGWSERVPGPVKAAVVAAAVSSAAVQRQQSAPLSAAAPATPAAINSGEQDALSVVVAPLPLQRASSSGGALGALAPSRMSRSSTPCDLEPGRGSKLRHASPSVEGSISGSGGSSSGGIFRG